MILLGEMLDTPAGNINEKASEKLIRAVVSMRLIKGPEEIRQIDKACQIGYQMHYTAMKTVRLGMKEQEVAGIMEGIAHSKGSMVSFSTILSQHGETMHNHLHDKIIENGKLILIDAGAENDMNYCSDFTRTIPSGGKFTQRQKEIYEIVSGANNLCQETARPGITYLEVHLKVCRHILCGLAGLGLVKGNIDEALAAGAAALFMPHGLGHNMGLDVHDMENLGEDFVGYDEGQHRSSQFGLDALRMARKLVPGHVITDEPGIYFIPALIEKWKREKINTRYIDFGKLAGYYDFGGIRLEDDILITESGCRLLGQKRLPITVENVEEEMKDNNR
jgi:Xaa-Pro aminopeptidase